MKVKVYHTYYGCESGCCGHVVELEDGKAKFEFTHPYYDKSPLEFAKNLIRETFGEEHIADLDWENSTICED